MCSHTFFETSQSTKVCEECGVEMYVLNTCSFQNCGFNMSHSPFLSGYSRKKRFRQMIDFLFFPTPCNADEKMLTYLAQKNIQSREHLFKIIKQSPLKDKRFVSVHVFCRLFVPEYSPPRQYDDLFRMKDRLVRAFEEIELRFKRRFVSEPFINYMFLVRFLLKKLGYTDYLCYVKQLKCEKRKDKYNNMMKQLGHN